MLFVFLWRAPTNAGNNLLGFILMALTGLLPTRLCCWWHPPISGRVRHILYFCSWDLLIPVSNDKRTSVRLKWGWNSRLWLTWTGHHAWPWRSGRIYRFWTSPCQIGGWLAQHDSALKYWIFFSGYTKLLAGNLSPWCTYACVRASNYSVSACVHTCKQWLHPGQSIISWPFHGLVDSQSIDPVSVNSQHFHLVFLNKASLILAWLTYSLHNMAFYHPDSVVGSSFLDEIHQGPAVQVVSIETEKAFVWFAVVVTYHILVVGFAPSQAFRFVH